MVKILRESLGEGATLARFSDHEFIAYLKNVTDRQLAEKATAVRKALMDASFTEGGQSIRSDFRAISAPIDAKSESAQKLVTQLHRAFENAPAETPPTAPAKTETPAAAKATAPASAGTKPAAPAAPRPAPAAPKVTPAAPAASASSASKASGDWNERIDCALQKDGFQLTYQPIINLHGDAAEYFEVLVRMSGRGNELISAGQFMPPAEQSGQSTEIDRWVVRTAVRALADLHAQNRQATFFVNLCASALKDKDLPPLLEVALKESKLTPKFLIFEVDESVVIASPAASSTLIKALKRIGCGTCVDNFGKALGAMTHMRDMPVDYVKIDGSLVQNLTGGDPVSQAAFKAVVEVAKALGKTTIAKNVESTDNLSALWNLGVDYVQGNYFQQADAELNYDFGGETTLSSDHHVPQWASGNGNKR